MKIVFVLFVFLFPSLASSQSIGVILPDSPVHKTLDERLHDRYGDPLKLDTIEPTWTAAAKTPGMLISGGLLFASTFADIASTRNCIDRHTCREGNPLLGQSRAQEYAVGLSLASLVYVLSVREKQHGHGVRAFTVMYAATALHAFAWAHNRSY